MLSDGREGGGMTGSYWLHCTLRLCREGGGEERFLAGFIVGRGCVGWRDGDGGYVLASH